MKQDFIRKTVLIWKPFYESRDEDLDAEDPYRPTPKREDGRGVQGKGVWQRRYIRDALLNYPRKEEDDLDEDDDGTPIEHLSEDDLRKELIGLYKYVVLFKLNSFVEL